MDSGRWTPMTPQPYTRDPEFGVERWKPQAPMVPGDRVRLRSLFLQGWEMLPSGGIIDHRGEWVEDPRKVAQLVRQYGADWCAICLPDGLVEDGAEYARRYEAHRERGVHEPHQGD